ncbi:hypothetical protein HDU91_003285 [Kappamyces sp. JEL0680]|nr:hypothetical protein HDU91_003285 [Kappamyces sp. JEL0680]
MDEALQARLQGAIEASLKERLARQTTLTTKPIPAPLAVLAVDGDEDKKRETLTSLLIRSASIGDLSTIQECLIGYREYIDINGKDDAGSNALTYSACLGHMEIVELLLKNGAYVPEKEAKYISILAMSNGHETIATMLLDHARTARALETDNDDYDSMDDFSDSGSYLSTIPEEDEEYESDSEEYEEPVMAADDTWVNTSTSAAQAVSADEKQDHPSDHVDSAVDVSSERNHDDPDDHDGSDSEATIDTSTNTVTIPLVDDADRAKMNRTLLVIVKQIVPSKKKFVPLGANCIFVQAKKYFDQDHDEMALEFLGMALAMITEWTNDNASVLYTTLYWISNTLQLLVYLKKDTTTMAKTIDIQMQLTDMAQTQCLAAEQWFKSQLRALLQTAILDHKGDAVTAGIRFDDTLSDYFSTATRFFGLGERGKHSPSQVIELFKTFLQTSESCSLNPLLSKQIVERVCSQACGTLVDGLVGNRTYCCRVRARQIQLNLSKVTQWIREHAAKLGHPETAQSFLKFNHALQFIQYASLFQDLDGFEHLFLSLTSLSRSMASEIMGCYRFEVGETKFSPQVVAWIEDETPDARNSTSFELEQFHLPIKQDQSENLWTTVPSIPPSVVDLLP